ncbi:MAG TPA: selenocysteine-specific translation elongation factor [Acidimicrobiia bacterium]
MRVVATAGHVDHGKSSLVLALTGTDPDRFAEEKARGLTIDLGFAFTTLPSGTEIGFVDVPGHVRFVKNMLAGVSAVDVVLFVVSAREGWMPQSEEHLLILELLGIEHGLVALTNADAVDPETAELARELVRERIERSGLAGAPIVTCDSVSDRGIDDVRVALDAAIASAPPSRDDGRPRLWIDRVFASRGAGTVVTGTLTGGPVAVDDVLQVAGRDADVRVRGIESANRARGRVAAGTRVALNLSGVDRESLARGDALVHAGQWTVTKVADVAVTRVPGAALPARARLQASVGSGEHTVAFRLLDGDGRFARVRFDAPIALPLAPGDRMVLRDPGREQLVGGAEVLEVSPPPVSRAASVARLTHPLDTRLLDGRPRVAVRDVERLTGVGADAAHVLVARLVDGGDTVIVGNALVASATLDTLRARVVELVTGTDGIELATLASRLGATPDEVRAAIEPEPELGLVQGIVHDAARPPRAQSPESVALVAQLESSPFAPPAPGDGALARALVREGVVVDVGGILFAASAVDRARALVGSYVSAHESLSVGEARELLGTSRKYAVPLLEHFDREGVTRRRGDVRVAGPRAVQL